MFLPSQEHYHEFGLAGEQTCLKQAPMWDTDVECTGLACYVTVPVTQVRLCKNVGIIYVYIPEKCLSIDIKCSRHKNNQDK